MTVRAEANYTPRIFVSSVIEGFEEMRAAVRQGVEAAGGKPVLVEDSPALPISPRNACLDLVRSCDGLVLVVGARGGFRAPSGKLVVEEEHDEAQRVGRPTWVFVQKVQRDRDAEDLVARVSAYVEGFYRREFETAAELEAACSSALKEAMIGMSKPEANLSNIDAALRSGPAPSKPMARLVLHPAVSNEVVDPELLDSESFKKSALQAGHDTNFFSYDFGSTRQATASTLTIQENQGLGRVIIGVDGLIVLDQIIATATQPSPWPPSWASLEIVAGDLERSLERDFAFGARVLGIIDPYHRYPTWFYSTALAGTRNRQIVDAPTVGSTAHTMRMNGVDLVTAFDAARQISRSGLEDYRAEARRAAHLLRKRLEETAGG